MTNEEPAGDRPFRRRSLNDPLAKISRAGEHLVSLKAEAREFLASSPWQNTRDTERAPEFVLYTFKVVRTPPKRVALIVADVVHNLRSALDHLAWQLARTTTETPYDRTFFPILKKDTAQSRRTFASALRDVPPEAQRIIAGFQPYQAGDEAENHPLWILQSLWNIDKHRAISPLAATIYLPEIIGHGLFRDQLEDGTIRYAVPKELRPEEIFEPNIRIELAFETVGPAKGATVEALEEMLSLIRLDIFPAFDAFVAPSDESTAVFLYEEEGPPEMRPSGDKLFDKEK